MSAAQRFTDALSIVIAFVLGSLLTVALVRAAVAAELEVHVINVGQADAILIKCPDGDHQMLIDAGDTRYKDSSTMFKEYMSSTLPSSPEDGDTEFIEVVIASHPHADHIGNMAWVFDTYDVGLYVDNGNVYDSKTYDRVETAWEGDGAGYWSAQDTELPDVNFCEDIAAVLLLPDGFGGSDDPNDNSVIVRLDYGDDSFLFVGDTEGELEELLLDDPATLELLDVDFLKVGHHGSKTSSSEEFLTAVTPGIAVISCGGRDVSTNKGYKHPRHEVVARILARVGARDSEAVDLDAYVSKDRRWDSITLNKAVYTTVSDGDLVFLSEGNGIRRKE